MAESLSLSNQDYVLWCEVAGIGCKVVETRHTHEFLDVSDQRTSKGCLFSPVQGISCLDSLGPCTKAKSGIGAQDCFHLP